MASEIIAMTGFFITLIVLIASFFRTRHKERMELIKSGKTANIFDASKSDSNGTLKLGLLMFSVGLGLLLGLTFDNLFGTEPAGVFVCMLILGGISLIYYHSYVEKKSNKKDIIHDDLV
jgi:F0F1-type ATP synthase assembly protein I